MTNTRSGGGHDQGIAFAGTLPQQGIRVIAMTRFGYLRTPMPMDASPAAQADAHACLLDALGKGIARYALEAIRAPTLVISVRDDGFGTYASSEYTASQIAGAKFIGFDNGGHLWVGHEDAVQAAIVQFLHPPVKP